MKNISTEPYKGVRDFYPEDKAIQNYIIGTMREVSESFGYEEYDASVLENAELYRAKSGDELVNEQTYTFRDRGERDVTLRPEMTPTLARMVAARKKSLVFPLRWYSIPNFFRYERPQRGRLREFWQLNVDIFGVEDISAEVEVIEMAYRIMEKFGIPSEKFEIRINDRGLMDEALADFGLDETQSAEMKKLLDKKDKIDNFEEEAEKIAGKPFDLALKANDAVKDTMEALREMGIENTVFSPTLMRGFDYYTGIVFEVFDKSKNNNRSLFGGGRYDRLLEIFGEEKVPAFGFGMGDVTIGDVLETYALLPEYSSRTNLYICTIDRESVGEAQKIAQKLREEGLNVIVDSGRKKVGAQIEYANKKKIQYIICVGQNELESGNYILKNLSSGEEQTLKLEEIPLAIK